MKILQLDRDTKKFRRDIAHIVGDSGLLRLWGYRLLANAKSAYLAHRDTGDMAASVKMHRIKSREGVDVDYEIYVDDNGAAKVEWGHMSGTKKTPARFRRWVPGRHILRNSLPGSAQAWRRHVKQSKKVKNRRERERRAVASRSANLRRMPVKRSRRRR